MYVVVNGKEESYLCDICLADELLDLVTNNDEIKFRCETWNDLPAKYRGARAMITIVEE